MSGNDIPVAPSAGASPSPGPVLGAILLAGGRATRMDGVAKPLLEVGGASLLAHALTAVRTAGCRRIVVVGPAVAELDAPDVVWTREDPPFGGPAAAVVAAFEGRLPADDPEWTFLLACDLPRVGAAVAQLARDVVLLGEDVEGLCLADGSGRPQWLTGAYRTRTLRASAARLPERGAGASVRSLLDDAAIAVVRDASGGAEDVDTWEDLKRFTGADEGAPTKEAT